MKNKDFEDVISADRMRRYVNACGGNVRKGITLYRYNLTLSSEMLKIISCFEVALRNRIDRTSLAVPSPAPPSPPARRTTL